MKVADSKSNAAMLVPETEAEHEALSDLSCLLASHTEDLVGYSVAGGEGEDHDRHVLTAAVEKCRDCGPSNPRGSWLSILVESFNALVYGLGLGLVLAAAVAYLQPWLSHARELLSAEV